jgi:hypothetical protein
MEEACLDKWKQSDKYRCTIINEVTETSQDGSYTWEGTFQLFALPQLKLGNTLKYRSSQRPEDHR